MRHHTCRQQFAVISQMLDQRAEFYLPGEEFQPEPSCTISKKLTCYTAHPGSGYRRLPIFLTKVETRYSNTPKINMTNELR